MCVACARAGGAEAWPFERPLTGSCIAQKQNQHAVMPLTLTARGGCAHCVRHGLRGMSSHRAAGNNTPSLPGAAPRTSQLMVELRLRMRLSTAWNGTPCCLHGVGERSQRQCWLSTRNTHNTLLLEIAQIDHCHSASAYVRSSGMQEGLWLQDLKHAVLSFERWGNSMLELITLTRVQAYSFKVDRGGGNATRSIRGAHQKQKMPVRNASYYPMVHREHHTIAPLHQQNFHLRMSSTCVLPITEAIKCYSAGQQPLVPC
jgi:hypothetical protein